MKSTGQRTELFRHLSDTLSGLCELPCQTSGIIIIIHEISIEQSAST
jgi:hypothetical protein